MGRPRKNPDEGLRVNVMFRLTEAMRDRVMARAGETGRSMSEELERIVENHFSGQDQRAMMREVVAEVLAERDAAEIAEGNRVPNDPMLEALWARHDA